MTAVTPLRGPPSTRGTLLLMPRDALSLEPMLPNETFEDWIGRVMAKHGSKFVVVRGIGEP